MAGRGHDHSKERLSSLEVGLAGAAAGAVTRFLTQPFDVLKIRFQLQVEPLNRKSLNSKYWANVQALRTIFYEEGVAGLWKGHNPGQLLSVTYGVVQFQCFELSTYTVLSLWPSLQTHSWHVNFWCGCLAGSAATVCSFPFDVVRTRFVAQGKNKAYYSMRHAVGRMVAEEGPFSLFKGLTPTLILVAPQAGAIFTFHSAFSNALNNFLIVSTDDRLSLIGNLVVGSLAGICGKSVVYPLDLARKRLQFQGFQRARQGFGENFTCRGLMNCLYKTVRKEGMFGLYKGLSPSILKAGITTALHFTVYHETCKMLEELHK